MRIGIIRARYNPFGGAEVFMRRFITGLVSRGHSVLVYSTDWPEERGVTLRRIRQRGPSFLRPLFFARDVAKAVEEERPGLVISFERTFSQDIYRAGDGCHREWLLRRGATVGPLKRLSFCISPKHRVLLYLEKRLFSDARLKKVVANSERGRAEIMRHYGLREEDICVIYNGVEPLVMGARKRSALRRRLRESLGIGADERVLLFVGSGFERKGLRYVIRALPSLKAGTRLVVMGKGAIGPYEKEARELNVAGRVIFMGPVKGASEYYPLGDVFVLPTIYEPFSNACIEAMAAGLPVVTSRVNGASEVIDDGLSGAIVEDPTDKAELARRITPFLDEKKARAAGAVARKRARDLTMDKNVEEFMRLVEEVVGAAGG